MAFFLCGHAAFMLAAGNVIEHGLNPLYAGDSMVVRVRIADIPKVQGDSVVMRVEPLADRRVPPHVRISWFNPPHVPASGEIWELEIRLQRPRGTSNPGVFDYESWLFREKIHATGYVVGSKRNRLLWSGSKSLLEQFRTDFARRARSATRNDAVAAVLVAIGVGQRHLISPGQWDRFALSGTSHLMAISGLHVGLAALFAFLVAFALAGLIPGCRNDYVIAVVCGTLCALAYAVISGLGIPAQRAVLMLLVAALSIARRRQVDPVAAITLAAGVVFLTDPIATMTPGFNLSFAAVVLLLWLARRKDVSSSRSRLLQAPGRLLVMQVFLLFGLLPLTASLFQRFAALATPVNLLAVPMFSVVTVPFVLAGLIVGEVYEPLALVLLSVAASSIELLDKFITRMVSLPFSDIPLAGLEGGARFLLLLPLAWVSLPRGWPGRRIAILGVISLVAWKPAPPPPGCFDAWVLDVGQGLAVVVQSNTAVMLFDTGMAWRSGGSAAKHSILPFLRYRGIKRIEWLVISHDDLDHSGGLEVVRDAVSVGTLIAGEMPKKGAHRPCRAGLSWQSAGVDFTILHPEVAGMHTGNAASCVLRVSVASFGLLLTGDIEAESERRLVQDGAELHSDVVVVPHHGSMTSSTARFIDAVRPQYAVVSAGYANRWGLPKPSVVERWQDAGAVVLNTATSGAVYFRGCADAGVVDVIEERKNRGRFWHVGT